MQRDRIQADSAPTATTPAAAGPRPADGPGGRGGRDTARHGRPLRLALIAFCAISLLPLTVLTEAARAQSDQARAYLQPVPPPAKTVQLLERLRDGGGQPRAPRAATRQRAEQRAKRPPANQRAKPGKQANAKKKQRRARRINRKGCVFRVQEQRWTLMHNCQPRGTIVIPTGFTLDGRHRTMFVTGNAVKFQGSVVAAGFGRANLRNLRIEGTASLTGSCLDLSSGVTFYYARGEIRNVTVRNIDLAPTIGVCGLTVVTTGMHATGQNVDILSSTVHHAGLFGIFLQDTVNSTIAGNNILISTRASAGFATGLGLFATTHTVVRNNDFRVGGDDLTSGLAAQGARGLSIVGNRFHGLTRAMFVDADFNLGIPAYAQIIDNHLAGVVGQGILVGGAAVQILRNTISGATSALVTNGIVADSSATGMINNNAIANFSCGVDLDPPTSLTLGTGAQANTFANNLTDVC